MRIERKVHCGRTLSVERFGDTVRTVTEHDAETSLLDHAHLTSHWAILISGAYLERLDERPYLRLPGDSVFYPALQSHVNCFGRLTSQCLNVEGDVAAVRERDCHANLNDDYSTLAQKSFQSDRSVHDWAQSAGCHRSTLNRNVRRATGFSPVKLRARERVRQAAEQAFYSTMSLGEIALMAGFFDQSHMTRTMVHLAGFTPSELRAFADESRQFYKP